MENNIIKLLKDKPLSVPMILINNYQSLNITNDELILIMVIMNIGNKVIYNPEEYANILNWRKHDVMNLINNLFDKNILSLIVEKVNRKTYEYISLDTLYNKLINIVIDTNSNEEIDNSIFGVFEAELGRMLTPMEYEKIKEWITSNINIELITLALKEAVLKGVNNLNYIDSILNSWQKKGYKNKVDVEKEKENYRNRQKQPKVDVFDTDWLNENE